jgi:hypothetical protein
VPIELLYCAIDRAGEDDVSIVALTPRDFSS